MPWHIIPGTVLVVNRKEGARCLQYEYSYVKRCKCLNPRTSSLSSPFGGFPLDKCHSIPALASSNDTRPSVFIIQHDDENV
jgi:hypothetical protein